MIRFFFKMSVGSWAAAALSILTLPIVTALIRPDEFGRAAIFSLAIGLAGQVALVGADQAFARDYYGTAKGHARAQLFRDSVAAPMALAVAFAIAVLFGGRWLTVQLFGIHDSYVVVLLAAGAFLVVVERIATLNLRMEQRAGAYSFLRLLLALTTFLVTLGYAWYVDASFRALATAQIVALAVVASAALALGSSVWRLGPVRLAGVRAALHYGLSFVPTFAAMWVVEGIDKIMLRHFADFTELGIFSAAYRFVALVALLQVSFSTFWVPVSFELFERDPAEAKSTFSRSLQLMTPVLLAGGFAALLAKDLVALLFAPDYRDAARVMPFLLFVPIMYALSEVTAAGINLKRRPRLHLVIAIATAIAAVLLNLLLVPPLGALGAAIATGASYLLFFALRTGLGQREFALDLRAGRLALAVGLFVAACAAHSFAPDALATYAATAIALLLCLGLYREELLEFGRQVTEKVASA